MLNASSLSRSNVLWFSENMSQLEFNALRLSSSIVVHPDFVYGREGLQQIVEGKAAYWVEERMPYLALKHNFCADYPSVVVPKVKVKDNEHYEKVMTDFYNKVLTSTQKYASFVDFGEYLVFADYADLASNLIDLAGNRGGLFAKSCLTIDTLLDEKIDDDIQQSIYLTYDAGKAGGSYRQP